MKNTILVGVAFECDLFDFDKLQNEITVTLKKTTAKDLEDMLYRMELTYKLIIDTLNILYSQLKRIGYTLPPGIYEIIDPHNTLECMLRC